MDMPHGLFGWVDLVTTDVPTAKAFYEGLFGWHTEDMPTPMGPAYTMCSIDGGVVAGIGPQPPGMADAGMPSLWNSYVLVEDIDAVCTAVAEAGGAVVMPAMQIMTQGRMAMVADPSGAVVGLWEPHDMQGAEVFNVPGALTWNELQTRDLPAATAFFRSVFGWGFEDTDGSGYLMITLDSKPGDDKGNGGAMVMPDGVPAEVPPYWAVYFAVADCDEAVDRATGLGGTVFLPPMQMGPGRFAGITDPTGAMFMLGHFG